MEGYVFDVAVVVLMVMPVVCRYPLKNLVLDGEWPSEVDGPVFDRTKQYSEKLLLINIRSLEKHLSTNNLRQPWLQRKH